MVDLTALPRSSLHLNSMSGWSMFVGILLVCPPPTLKSNLPWFWLVRHPISFLMFLHPNPQRVPLRLQWTAPNQFIFPAVMSLNKAEQKMYAFFWVIPRCLNFMCQCFWTLCLFRLHRRVGMKNFFESSHLSAYENGIDSVPKRQHIKFGRQGITQKKAYDTQNTAKENKNCPKTTFTQPHPLFW